MSEDDDMSWLTSLGALVETPTSTPSPAPPKKLNQHVKFEEDIKEVKEEKKEKNKEESELNRLRAENASLKKQLSSLAPSPSTSTSPSHDIPSSILQRAIVSIDYYHLTKSQRKQMDLFMSKAIIDVTAPSRAHKQDPEIEAGEVDIPARDPNLNVKNGCVTYFETFCIDRLGVRNFPLGVYQPSEVDIFEIPSYDGPFNMLPLPIPIETNGKPLDFGCFNCGTKGHSTRDCNERRDPQTIKLNQFIREQIRDIPVNTTSRYHAANHLQDEVTPAPSPPPPPKPDQEDGEVSDDDAPSSAPTTARSVSKKVNIASDIAIIEDADEATSVAKQAIIPDIPPLKRPRSVYEERPIIRTSSTASYSVRSSEPSVPPLNRPQTTPYPSSSSSYQPPSLTRQPSNPPSHPPQHTSQSSYSRPYSPPPQPSYAPPPPAQYPPQPPPLAHSQSYTSQPSHYTAPSPSTPNPAYSYSSYPPPPPPPPSQQPPQAAPYQPYARPPQQPPQAAPYAPYSQPPAPPAQNSYYQQPPQQQPPPPQAYAPPPQQQSYYQQPPTPAYNPVPAYSPYPPQPTPPAPAPAPTSSYNWQQPPHSFSQHPQR